MKPLQNCCRSKNVIEHNASIYCRAADTGNANECFMQPHYEPWREVIFLGFLFTEEQLEVGNWVRSTV